MIMDILNLPTVHTVAFTGRRPKDLLGYKAEPYEKAISATEIVLNALWLRGASRFVSGGAQGFDQIAFHAVHHLKSYHPEIQNILDVPCSTQADRWAEKGVFSREEYNAIMNAADSVNIIDPTITASSDSKQVSRAMHLRNHAMVDACDVLVALVPAGEELTHGGTFATIQYAKSQKKTIIYLKYRLSTSVDIVDVEVASL